MSRFDNSSILAKLEQMLSRINKFSTADGKIRSDGDGTLRQGVQKIHTHMGTGEGGDLIAGVTPNFLTVTRGTPTLGDDSDSGFQIGSQWIDTRANAHYICFDATIGAAVWKVSTTIDAVTDSLPIVSRRRIDWELFEEEEWDYTARAYS